MAIRPTSEKELELIEFIAEMNELIEGGALRFPFDFQLWLDDVRKECLHCYNELSYIVNEHVKYLD